MFVRQGVLGGMKVPNTCSSSSLSLSLECHFIKDFDELSWVGNQQSTPKHLYYVYCLELLMIKQLKLLEILGRYPHKRICTDLGYLGMTLAASCCIHSNLPCFLANRSYCEWMTPCLGSQLLPFPANRQSVLLVNWLHKSIPCFVLQVINRISSTMYMASVSTELNERGEKSNKQFFFYTCLSFSSLFLTSCFLFCFSEMCFLSHFADITSW